MLTTADLRTIAAQRAYQAERRRANAASFARLVGAALAGAAMIPAATWALALFAPWSS